MEVNLIKLSDHFSLAEATRSSTADRLGIDNTKPSAEIIKVAANTATYMELVRAILHGKSIHIDSWIRSLPLNRALGSRDSSQHLRGEAVDFICPEYGNCLAIAREIIARSSVIPFDQLILEHSWIHISFLSPNTKPRGQVLSLLSGGGYATGLTNNKGVKYE